MSFWHMSRLMDRIMEDYMREMARNENRVSPYWRDADHSILQVANEAHQTVNDDKKFAVTIDVSQFRPEELKVNLDGRCLTVEGKQEQKDDRSFMARSFVRSWTLPEDANLEALRTELSDRGQLTIEAPKTGTSGTKKNIPICPAHK
ncbi:Hsp20/alpha crystallin family protein [Ancylostoma ceylanicum]|uniref:Hsp20/alpha crystallin family protein n=1 Tax=Ancylostoma ceylanicum TaxID=53326 RepID=A0A0D6LHD9_9BILA|nr:Hsp20/alpha crystallin family protein [Ancylostoma ceylanicum]